ncbi:MAG: alginate lyase family protein [Variibacter sp.]|nr:alginate lyase family protein [Variibacter sp.]
MSLTSVVARARRLARKRPAYILDRALREAECELDRWLAPRRARRLDRRRLLALAKASSVDELWTRLADRAFPATTAPMSVGAVDAIEPGESARIFAAAERAVSRTVDLLGSGPVSLGTPVDWSRDYKTGMGWPCAFARAIDYVNRERPSDVKVPWEISRLQWLIPAGQGYLLSGDERYAAAVRDLLEEWMQANPLAYSVNWSCTMEAAMRIFTWTWFFHVFARSRAWADEAFRLRFLSCLYLHGDFTRRHIEKADINGNHYTADLAGLVFAGLFFGNVGAAPRWAAKAWAGLCAEIERQVFPDGVDYEASCAYHRLVCELFLWPALYRLALGKDVPPAYAERLRRMARFTAAYARADGSSPLWGDADDGRVLPFGGQPVGDHRYLLGMVALAFADRQLADWFGGGRSELLWTFGPERARALPTVPVAAPGSRAFPDGGCYVMRDGGTHVFIDCGPVGLAGRGGHGHNDALSFEAWLEGAPLIVDSGSYVYTASFDTRNRFRATACHNTPQVDRQEINRFDPANLWALEDDARPTLLVWRSTDTEDVFVGRHRGYERLGIAVERTIRFDKRTRALEIVDRVEGEGEHTVTIPLHLAPGVSLETGDGGCTLRSAGRDFEIAFEARDGWTVRAEPCLISPSYGVGLKSQRLVWTRQAARLPAILRLIIRPLQVAGGAICA